MQFFLGAKVIEKTVIIGHGPSLQNSRLGERIDAFKYVVRFPYVGDWQAAADYGTRTSFVCATVGRARDKLRNETPDKGYFFWDKKGEKIPEDLISLIELFGGENVTALIVGWQKKMTKLKPVYPYFSHGTAAICIMAHKFRLPVVALGSENLSAGNSDHKEYIGSWYHEERRQPPSGHDLAAERQMLEMMATKYNVKIGFKLND